MRLCIFTYERISRKEKYRIWKVFRGNRWSEGKCNGTFLIVTDLSNDSVR